MSWIRKDEIKRFRVNPTETAGITGQKPKPDPPSGEPRLFLHVDMDAFFASVEERDHPELKGHPVAVGGSSDGKRGIITAANYVARKYGLKAGMPAIEAKRLCPNVMFVGLDARKYTYASAQIMELLERFSPSVKVLSVDEASLDITGLLEVYGSPTAIGARVKRAIREDLNLPCTAGIAANRLVAKVAADSSKPDGLRYIPAGTEAEFLAPMPVSKMCGIGPATERALRRLGVSTLGELAKAPDDLMKLRFGVMGPWLAQMARGEYVGRMKQDDDRGSDEKSMGHERTFFQPVSSREELRSWIVALAEMVTRRVRSGKVVGRVLTLKLRYSDFVTLHHQGALHDPTDNEETIIDQGWKLLDQTWEVGRPVRLLGLSLGELSPRAGLRSQLGLFDSRRALDHEALYRAVDSIRDKFGEKIIVRAMGSPNRIGKDRISFGSPR